MDAPSARTKTACHRWLGALAGGFDAMPIVVRLQMAANNELKRTKEIDWILDQLDEARKPHQKKKPSRRSAGRGRDICKTSWKGTKIALQYP